MRMLRKLQNTGHSVYFIYNTETTPIGTKRLQNIRDLNFCFLQFANYDGAFS